MSLALPSQLLLQQDLPEQALLINPPHDDLASEISDQWVVASFSHATDNAYQKAGFTTQSITELPTTKFSQIYIFFLKPRRA